MHIIIVYWSAFCGMVLYTAYPLDILMHNMPKDTRGLDVRNADRVDVRHE